MQTDDGKITVEKCKDSGLALVLLCLIGYQLWKLAALMLLAIVFLVVAMTYPLMFLPFARIWFALSTALGTIVSKAVLSMLFFAIVFPVGVLRRALGKDSMKLRAWKKGRESVFRVRNHTFRAEDLEHPY